MTRAQAEQQIDWLQGRLLMFANLPGQPIAWFTSLEGSVVPITKNRVFAALIYQIRDLRRSYVYPGFGRRKP